jgi:hypothetical protein
MRKNGSKAIIDAQRVHQLNYPKEKKLLEDIWNVNNKLKLAKKNIKNL